MFPVFSLTLVVNHACNLRCRYCYTGEKFSRAMTPALGRHAIDSAIASLAERGLLELDFFGGEPLLEAESIARWMDYAAEQTQAAGAELRIGMTTNGTLADGLAWELMLDPRLHLNISCDGAPEVHDRNRVDQRGQGTAEQVLGTIDRLVAAGREVRVVMVVRPNNVSDFAAGLEYLFERGVSHVTPSLDLWSHWTADDADLLASSIADAADVWARHLPHHSVSWFDEKAATLLRSSATTCTARCQFGQGQVAVAPSGNLYPCERLVGEDTSENATRMSGQAMQLAHFRDLEAPDGPLHSGCSGCQIQSQCTTACRCSNYVRTGDIRRPDGLLCLFDQVCYRETQRVLEQLPSLHPQLTSI